MSEKLVTVVKKFLGEYNGSTSKRLKIIDSYLFYILLTGVFQFGYCALVGTFPFNSFLSGFISCVGSFVIAGNYFNENVVVHLTLHWQREFGIEKQIQLKNGSIVPHKCIADKRYRVFVLQCDTLSFD